MDGIPKNAVHLAEVAAASGWQVGATSGRGTLLNKRAPNGFDVVESLAVRLCSSHDHIRAFGVWVKPDGGKWKFDNGQVRSRDGSRQGVLGYRELRGLIAEDES